MGWRRARQWVIGHGVAVSAGFATLVTALVCINGYWRADSWHHSAVVRELATHPVHPSNPLLAVDAPHIFFGPYSLAIGLLCRLTGLGAVPMLAAIGLINIPFLFFAIQRFARTFLRGRHTPVLAILLILFWWSPVTWQWSGMFHLGSIVWGAPYPSTFCSALILLGWCVHKKWLERPSFASLAVIFLISEFTLLSHTFTAIVFWVGLYAFSFAHGRGLRPVAQIAVATGLVVSTIGLALWWPYYPVWDLITKSGSQFHAGYIQVYEHVLPRSLPGLLLFPFLVMRLRRNNRDPLFWMFIGFTILFVFGGVTHAYSYGRVIFFAIYVLQLSFAEYVGVRLDQAPSTDSDRARRRWLSLGFAVPLAVMAACILPGPLARAIPPSLLPAHLRDDPRFERESVRYRFLGGYVGQQEVVFADILTSFPVPTYGGKVVASAHKIVFVEDTDQRAQDLLTFFNPTTTRSGRLELLRKYHAQWLLLDTLQLAKQAVTLSPELEHELSSFGETVYQKGSMTLIRLHTFGKTQG